MCVIIIITVIIIVIIAFKISGTIGSDSMGFLHDLRRRLRLCTGDPNSFMYLLQRLSVVIQVGN